MESTILSDNFIVTLWSISQLSWENISYAAEIITEHGNTYKTWVISDHNFQCLTQQSWWDKIKEIKIINGNEKLFLSSKLISETVKNKLKHII